MAHEGTSFLAPKTPQALAAEIKLSTNDLSEAGRRRGGGRHLAREVAVVDDGDVTIDDSWADSLPARRGRWPEGAAAAPACAAAAAPAAVPVVESLNWGRWIRWNRR